MTFAPLSAVSSAPSMPPATEDMPSWIALPSMPATPSATVEATEDPRSVACFTESDEQPVSPARAMPAATAAISGVRRERMRRR
ncbi:hypothetical protein QP157_19420 [Sphingomonas sp. LR61]|uniref:hypothetical protein n=1 Tax=Sphingomonas sp. LR61 TaxID=3050234 RepID=UPI002FE0451F